MNATQERSWNDVVEGERLESLDFPLTVLRLVMAAGANRDFNAIHHNAEVARQTGAPDIYANNMLLQGMWERVVRGYIGQRGIIRALKGFRMRSFNTPGDTLTVGGHVVRKWLQDGVGWIEVLIQTENSAGVSVGPGTVLASMPLSTR
jgi:acyl dehydratase